MGIRCERELGQARALWHKVLSGQGQTLLVSGEPGIGKTRLVQELVTQVRVAGSRALEGACYAEGSGSYAPFAQILRRAFRDGAAADLDLPEFVLADQKLAAEREKRRVRREWLRLAKEEYEFDPGELSELIKAFEAWAVGEEAYFGNLQL